MPKSESESRRWWSGPWPIAVACFAWCLFFYTRHSGHPFYYEKDAPSKVAQVLTGGRNYYHPLLMLNAADAALRLSGQPRTEQNAGLAGRRVIAFFAALAVVGFTLLAHRCGGWLAALAVGALLCMNAQLLELAHYFKEDPAFLAGLACSFLAMKLFHEQPTPARAAFLGAACALALAGKYVGIAAPLLALPLLIVQPSARRGPCLGLFFAAFFAVLFAINYQWIPDFRGLIAGFDIEVTSLTRPAKLNTVPHIRDVVEKYGSGVPLFIALGVVLQVVDLARRDGRKRPVEWMLIGFPAVFTVVLAWTPRLFERHFLPVFICLWVSGGLGWVNAIRWLWQRFPRLPASSVAVTLGVLALGLQLIHHPFTHLVRDLGHDHRRELADWILAHLPADAVIAQDEIVFLGDPLPQKIVSKHWLADFESLASMRSMGVTHVAMHSMVSGRFMHGGKGGKERKPARDKSARAEFYRELEAHAQTVFEIRDGDDGALNPGLLLYALDQAE